jgi:hypothetical protein
MVIMICCITILITYIVIFGFLTYYFIKKRTVWNELFSINSITDTLVEIFACPEHFIIYIPGVLFENTPCVQNKRKKNENKEKIKIVLTKINTLFKKFINVGLEKQEQNLENPARKSSVNTRELEGLKPSQQDLENSARTIENNNSISNNINQVKWILDGTLDNFNNMYDETAEFYNNLSGSYKILNENTNNINNTNSNLITLEKLVLLEQNIEYCDNILKLLEIIDYKHYIDTAYTTNSNELKNVFQIENNYMICLIYNLIESVRLYKIRMCEVINF